MSPSFETFGLPAKLLAALQRIGFTEPTPIQAEAIPLILEGRDVLGSAQTGTGKTGAFGIPLIARLMKDKSATALIMSPTRELAAQIVKAIQGMTPDPLLRTALLIGGESMGKQLRQLSQNPRLIIGTPGRINDHLTRKSLSLAATRFLVLDETDRMLDMGFGIQIEKIVAHVPDDRQTLLFSATMPKNIMKLAGKYLKEPERIAIGSTTAPAAKIRQELVHTTEPEKYKALVEKLDEREGSVIIFVKTKFGTERLAKKLNAADHKADAIHGDLHQRRRDRVIRAFRDKEYRILVATDVAARGLDIPHIEHVINYDLPQCPEDYIHRIGRTARAGAEGEAINFLTPADHAKWRAIDRLLNGTEHTAEGPGQGRGKGPGKGRGRSFGKGPGKGFGKGSGPRRDRPRTEGDSHETHADQANGPQRPRRFKKPFFGKKKGPAKGGGKRASA